MPLHDWTQVTPNEFHHFHLSWIYTLADELNSRQLPEGYMALGEYSLLDTIPDVLTLSTTETRPEVQPQAPSHREGTTVVKSRPKTQFMDSGTRSQVQTRQRRILVQRVSSRQVVAVIEIVSPSNKASAAELRRFVGKCAQYLRRDIQFLLLDLFPTSPRQKQGVPGAIWKELTGTKLKLPDQSVQSRYFSSFVAAVGEYQAYIEPRLPGEDLPAMPLFLSAEEHINLPLEATYQRAFSSYPAVLRDQVQI